MAKTRTRDVRAAGALLELDEWSLRPLTGVDYPLVESLRDRIAEDVFRLPPSAQRFRAFLQLISARPWSLPIVPLRAGEPAGLCYASLSQLRNLNAYLVALFLEPERAGRAIALYTRHVFWNYPLHRFNVQLPLRDDVEPLIQAHLAAGFEREGTLIRHGLDAGGERDVAVLGLLRADLEAWATRHDPRLALS